MPRVNRDQVRADILTAAAALFAQRGYRDTTVADIAAAVGYSKAAVLYHFAGKDELFATYVGGAVSLLDELDAEVSALPAAERPHAAGLAFARLLVAHRDQVRLLQTEMPALLAGPPFADVLSRVEGLRAHLTGPRPTRAARARAEALLAGLSAAAAALSDVPDAALGRLLIDLVDRLLTS